LGFKRNSTFLSLTANGKKLKKKNKTNKQKTILVIVHPQVAKAKFGYRSERKIDFLG
jgi:hypothetical protein